MDTWNVTSDGTCLMLDTSKISEVLLCKLLKLPPP